MEDGNYEMKTGDDYVGRGTRENAGAVTGVGASGWDGGGEADTGGRGQI